MNDRVSSREKRINKTNDKQPDASLRVLDELPSMTWRADSNGSWYFFNRSWLVFTGRTLEQEMGEGWMQGVHSDDLLSVKSQFADAFARREPFEIEYRLRTKSGEYCWILNVNRPLIEADGSFSGFIGTCYDLTERKQMEQALRNTNQALEAANAALTKSEMLFKGLFEHAPDAVLAVSSEGKIILANEQAQAMFGYTRQEFFGQPIEMLMPANFHEIHRQHMQGYMHRPRTRPMGVCLALFAQRKDGTLFPVDINLGPMETENGIFVLATVRDTTDRKKAEEALRVREKMLTSAAASSGLVFFRIDHEGVIQFSLGQNPFNPSEPVELTGKSIYELGKDTPQAVETFERARGGETISNLFEIKGKTFEVSCTPLKNDSGETSGIVGVSTEVTKHRKVQQALRESDAHFRTIFNDAILGIHLVNAEGQIVESNRALQEMLGYSDDELRQKHFFDLIFAPDVTQIRKRLDEMAAGKLDHFQTELRYVHKNGQALWSRLAMSLFRRQEGRPFYAIGMVENNTAQKQAEAELAEVQRRLIDSAELERLQLAQELHDGPLQELQAMSFRLSMLETIIDDAEGRSELTALQEEMRLVVQSIRGVCGDLRPPALAPFGLEKAIQSHAERFQEMHPDIRLRMNLTKDGQELSERVRLALFRIYQHSMANIARHSQAKTVWIVFKLEEDTAELRIEDDGKGFHVPKRGIELVRQGHFGLVGSIERAESVGGMLEIQSSPGNGTVIHVSAPRREEDQITSRERFSTITTRGL